MTDDRLETFFSEDLPRYTFDVVLRGYDRHQVHELFARIDTTLDETANDLERVTPDVIRATTLRVALRGYNRRQVDAALLDVVKQLEPSS